MIFGRNYKCDIYSFVQLAVTVKFYVKKFRLFVHSVAENCHLESGNLFCLWEVASFDIKVSG